MLCKIGALLPPHQTFWRIKQRRSNKRNIMKQVTNTFLERARLLAAFTDRSLVMSQKWIRFRIIQICINPINSPSYLPDSIRKVVKPQYILEFLNLMPLENSCYWSACDAGFLSSGNHSRKVICIAFKFNSRSDSSVPGSNSVIDYSSSVLIP